MDSRSMIISLPHSATPTSSKDRPTAFSRLPEKENDFVTVSSGCCSQNDHDILSKTGQRCQMIKILLLTLIPIIILSGITLFGLIENIPAYAVKDAIRHGIYTSLDIGALIHQIQLERGTSVMYLSSNGHPSVYNALLSTHTDTDIAIAELEIWPTSTNVPEYFKSKVRYQQRIQQYRDLVMNNNITVSRVIEFYSDLNDITIDWVAPVVSLAGSGHLSRSVVAYQLLLLAKDETGVERALGSSFYARGNFSRSELALYVETKTTALMYTKLCVTYSSHVSTMLNDLYTGTDLEVLITEMRRQIVENDFSAPSSLRWFANMSSYINILKDIQDKMGSSILSVLQTELDVDTTDFNISIGIMVGTVFLYPLILVVVFKLTHKIQRVAASLQDQTSLLSKERKISEGLLCEMLPVSVARKLMANEKVEPRMYKCATVFFSDVVGFTTICSGCTPFEVVDFLNMLYNTFDSTLEEHDVYKVETIGDAYMVVSGIPEVNGDRHVKEIALMALGILDATSGLDVPHLSRKSIGLQVRVGINTGPVVSGIVGIKMPRYCLFGDTVNVAARMESTGTPQKIQLSEATAVALKKYDCFQTKERGLVEIKGKGMMTTFWLEWSSSLRNSTEPTRTASTVPIVVIE